MVQAQAQRIKIMNWMAAGTLSLALWAGIIDAGLHVARIAAA